MKLHTITWGLVIIGGINWLLIGILDWGIGNLVGLDIARIIYIVIGLSALYELFNHKKICKNCAPASSL